MTHPPQPLSDDEWAAARIEGQWTPLTMAAAEWAAQRLSEANEELDVIKVEVADYVLSVKAWAEGQLKGGRAAELASDVQFFEHALKAYARTVRDQSVDRNGKARVKTIKLPTATLETKAANTPKPKFIVVDMDALVKWAEEACPDAIERTVNVSKLKLLAMDMPNTLDEDGDADIFVMTADGERVPGMDWDIEPPKDPHVIIRLHNEGE